MVNSIKLAAELIARLPKDRLSPETTEAREGFVHPTNIVGGAAETTVKFICRDFDRTRLKEHEQLIRDLAAAIGDEEPRATLTVEVKESYWNMKEFLVADPRLLTPNIFTGGQEYHSVREWISVQDMAASAAAVVELVKLWAEPDWAERK